MIDMTLRRLRSSSAASLTYHKALIKKVEELIPIYGMEWKSVITYTPEKGWINDLCGPIYFQGIYHLYYQFHPKGYLHEDVAWGHATSCDLVNWHDENVAIPYTDEENILGGSAIYDENNTSEFGGSGGPIVIIYANRFKEKTEYINGASIDDEQNRCAQNIAYSQDMGNTWNVYENNPILYTPMEFSAESENFTGPTIFRYRNKWVLVVMLYSERIALFHESSNLKDWTLISKFSLNTPSTSKEYKANWKYPDIFEMKVQGQGETKWILLLTLENENTDSVYYIIGHFDGTQFKIDNNQKDDIKRLDYGSDFFAAKTWNNAQNHRYIIGLVEDWPNAKMNSNFYRGGLSLVRELNLIKNGDQYKLFQNPIENIEKYVSYTSGIFNIEQMKSGIEIIRNNAYNFIIKVIGIKKETMFSLIIQNEEKNDILGRGEAGIIYNANTSTISIEKFFSKDPVSDHIAKLVRRDEMGFSIFIDNNTLTLFCNDGEAVFTELLITTSEKRILKLAYDTIKMSTSEFFVIQKLLYRH